ncbi:MAG: hypothetical protein ACKPKO_14320, partial [Candidatus Fonsibacter sp.]
MIQIAETSVANSRTDDATHGPLVRRTPLTTTGREIPSGVASHALMCQRSVPGSFDGLDGPY